VLLYFKAPIGHHRRTTSDDGSITALIVCTDDEPADGPQHYVVITGFYEPHLLTYLDELGIAIDCIIGLQTDSKLTASLPPTGTHCSNFSFFEDLSFLSSKKFKFATLIMRPERHRI